MNSHQVRGIIFRLHHDWFFVDIMRVREITRYQQPAVPAGMPRVVAGVMAYRAGTVPVIALRQRFGLPEGDDPARSRIVMLAMPGRTIGMLVDEVGDQMVLSAEAISPTSPLVPPGIAEYLIGTAQAGELQLLLVDIDRLLSPEEQRTLDAAVQAARTARAEAS